MHRITLEEKLKYRLVASELNLLIEFLSSAHNPNKNDSKINTIHSNKTEILNANHNHQQEEDFVYISNQTEEKLDDFEMITAQKNDHLVSDTKFYLPITNKHSLAMELNCYPFINYEMNPPQTFIVTDVVKDSDDHEIEGNLPYIGEVLKQLLSKLKGDEILIFPMRMCLNFTGVFVKTSLKFFSFLHTSIKPLQEQREHIVIVEVNLKDRRIKVHDSESSFWQKQYHDILGEVATENGLHYNPKVDYNAYNQQKPDNSLMPGGIEVSLCGYYSFEYIFNRLLNQNCDKIKIHISTLKDKKTFLTKYFPTVLNKYETGPSIETFDDDELGDAIQSKMKLAEPEINSTLNQALNEVDFHHFRPVNDDKLSKDEDIELQPPSPKKG